MPWNIAIKQIMFKIRKKGETLFMIAPFKLPDNGIPIKVGDRSYIYKNVFHPIEWFSGEPFRPRVETLVINKTGTEIFLRIKEDKSGYRIPGGSIDEDSTYEKQAENETNEEALISIVDLKATNITYTELFKKDFIKNGGDSPISYAGFITYVYMATYGGKVDKSTIEEKDLDDDMAENGKFYPIASVIDLLSKPHIEALSKSDKIAINLRWIINKRLDNLNIGNEKKPIFEMGNNLELRGENSYIYHGSMHKIDSFRPMSLDLGNGLQEPGWSTFCFRNYTWAKRFALMRLIQKYFDGKKEKNELKKCGWDMFSNRPYIHKSVFEELCNNLKDQCFYVYTINAENLELGLGNDLRFPEVTFRESGVVPEKRDCIYASEDVLRTELMILTDIEPDRFEKLMLSKVEELNRGWISCMINRNYVADSEVGKLTKAVSEGKLKPGDDVKKYIEANGIVLKDVSFVERLTELDNTDDIKKKESNVSESFDVSEEYEETIILGDSRALFTSTEYDVCSEDKTDEKDTLFPSDDDIPQDAKLQYKRFLYNIHESGQLFLMAKSDFTTFESKNGIFGILRVFVRPMYRMKKLGSILVEDVLRFVKTITPMTILVEVSDGISSSSGIKNWIMSYGFSIMTRTDKTVGFKLDTSILESYTNLSNFSYYHAMFPKPGYKAEWAYGWDEEQYYKDIESAIIAEMKHQKDAKGKDLYSEEKFTLNMYTMGDECSSIYLGKITVYNMEKGGINWEWEEQEDLDPSMVSYIKEEVQKKPPVDLSDIPLPDDVVVTNEGNCYCESDVTRFEENFKKKGSLQLSTFKRIKADKATISKYKNSLKLLNYSDIDRDVCVGYIWIDGNDDVVGACAVEYGVLEKFNWITVIEVATKYQGYGIGRQLLDHVVKSLKGNIISVWEHNPVALQMYEKYGFKISKLSLRDVKSKKSCMYFMYLPTALSQSDINSANETTIGQAKEVDEKVNYIRNNRQRQNVNVVVESTIEYIEENVIFNKDNTAYNVDKFESGESNMLFVTGLSGSGKSTLAKRIATEYNAEWIELDNFEHCHGFTDSQLKEAGEVFYEYLSNHKSLWEKLKVKEITGKELGKEIKKFVHYCISWCRERKDKKFVIEGVQIYAFLDSSTLKSQPVIIMGTSAKNSILQRFRRNGDGKIEWGKEIKNEFPNLLAWYWGEEKNLKSFRKDMKTGAVVETVIVIEAEGDEDLPSLGKDDKTEDYSADAEKSVDDEQQNTDNQNDESKDDDTSVDGEGEPENPDNLDNELGGSDYTEDAENSDSEDMEDSSSGEPIDTDNIQENKSQSNNNTIKNYSILRDFESLYRLANEISDTLDPILMEKPIQNKVLTQVRENLSAIKKAITDFITLHFKASDYAFNLYYYEVFLGAVKKNVEILAKNKLLSTDNSKKRKPERK